jgi:hypothetical protein
MQEASRFVLGRQNRNSLRRPLPHDRREDHSVDSRRALGEALRFGMAPAGRRLESVITWEVAEPGEELSIGQEELCLLWMSLSSVSHLLSAGSRPLRPTIRSSAARLGRLPVSAPLWAGALSLGRGSRERGDEQLGRPRGATQQRSPFRTKATNRARQGPCQTLRHRGAAPQCQAPG